MLPTSERLQLTSSRYSVHCPFLSLSSLLKKNPKNQGALGGASKLHLLSLGAVWKLPSPDATPAPVSLLVRAPLRPERQPIACRDHFRSWKLDQSKRSVLKRPVRIQDVCAHALLEAFGDFFLYSVPLWYRAEPEDYAGPDSPRSLCSTETGPSYTNRALQEMSLPHQENQVFKCLHYCIRRGSLETS